MNKVVSILLILLFGFSAMAQDQAVEGKKIFQQNCSSCHKIDGKLIGPPLDEALDQWGGDKAAMYTWIRNWAQAVEEGHPRAIEVQNYDPSAMTMFPQLSDEDIDKIFAYVDNPSAAGDSAPAAALGDDVKAGGARSINWVLLGLLLLFILLALILSQVSDNLARLVAQQDGEPLPTQKSLFEKLVNKKTLGLLALLATGFIGFTAYKNAAMLGRSKGYQPTQPIAFSHKLHAGTLQIDCQYCHTSAAVSKQASIPATNVCMNCHKGVQEGPTTGTNEISKIYAAAGFNPETMQYDKESTGPVEWIRIHNLPDHVYFNHSQHVTAGNIECQTCHGPIEEMEVVEQNSDLSMGWCIDCHRNTKVQFTENAYYDDLFEEYHDKIAAGEKDFFVTVEKIGGTECQKCHY